MPTTAYAELHSHTNFSFLDGASSVDDLVERAVELGLGGLAVTDHQGLYGVVRFVTAAQAVGLHPVVGIEIELLDPAVPDPAGVVIPARRPTGRRGRKGSGSIGGGGHGVPFGPCGVPFGPVDGMPARPRPSRARLPGHRAFVKEDLRGIGERQRGPHLVLLARDAIGYRSLCRLVSRANLAGTKAVPHFTQTLLADHAEGLVALSGCREGEVSRRLRVGDRAGARAVAERYARIFGGRGPGSDHGRSQDSDAVARSGFALELQHHLLPDDDWLVAETAALAGEIGLPVVVTNDVHYARPDDRELGDVLTAIRHGRTLDTLADLRRPDGESYLKSERELAALPPVEADDRTARAWAEGLTNAGDLAAACSVDLGFERYRFPGFDVPGGETAFSYLEQLCHEGARRRYHPMTPAVVRQLAHELEVIERTGLAEFFLICWDLMCFAKSRGIPAQGRGSAADSIVAYVLGITRVDPIRHRLLFERFINEGRTTYPDVDIDFSSERREEVIQYVYARYGAEHTGMVCNIVTYRARSAVREIGYALGFPRPLVDRVSKALETYDSVMVRRDLEAEGGFAQFFERDRGRGERDRGRGEATSRVRGGEATSRVRGGEATSRVRGGEATSRVRGGEATSRVRDGAEAAGRDGAEAGTPLAAVAREGLADGYPGIDEPDSSPDRPSGSPDDRPLELDHARPELDHAHGELAAHPSAGPGEPRPIVIGPDSPTWNIGDGPRLLPALHGSRPAIRPGGPGDDKGGPGDSPASVAWLRNRVAASPPGTPAASPPGTIAASPPGTIDGRRIDPESGVLEAPPRRTDKLGRPVHWDPPPTAPGSKASSTAGTTGSTAGTAGTTGSTASTAGTAGTTGSTASTAGTAGTTGSTRGLSDWERWLELCARIDGFPRHLSIHTGGMLVTAAPLIDIAPLERATMPDRVVVQYDKRDVETLKLIKLDLLGLGMLAAIDETLRLIEHDCAVCVDLDRLPEDIPEVFAMLQAADTVGVFQVESRAQMQTLPKSRPQNLDDLVVEVAIIRPGPIQGNAVHPYLRRKQGLEPVTYLHPSLEPILGETLGVILYQEQVMKIAIDVAGFTPADSDGFRRAMGTWRSTREMEKLHRQFVEGCLRQPGMDEPTAEELFRRVAAFASFGFAKSHAAAFARTAYESSFLKLFYPAQFLVGLLNAQPMGFYPVEVLVNDAKRHGVAVLPVDINESTYRTTTEWVGRPGWEPLPPGAGIDRRPEPVRSPACVIPSAEVRERWAAESSTGYGVRLGLRLVNGIGDEQAERLDTELVRGPYRSLADVVARTGLSEEVVERLVRAGALDSLGRPRRELLWQLREVFGATTGRVDGRATGARRVAKRAAGRPMDLRLPPTPAPALPPITEVERLGDAYAILALDARQQVVGLFRGALDRLGAVPNSALAERAPGAVRIGGLVVTRQHPMTAKGTVFLALEDETGMVNVTLWPDAWERLRGVVRRHALLLVEGTLQRDGNVVNVVAREIRSLPDATAGVGGPARPPGVRQLGWAGMRRVG